MDDKKLSFPEPLNSCYPAGYEKFLAMQKYGELRKQVLDKLKCKQGTYGSIIAVKIVTKDDFELLKKYCISAYTACGDNAPANVNGEFQGVDWYFVENVKTPRGIDEYGYKCYLTTLSQKKKDFAEFLSEFEGEKE